MCSMFPKYGTIEKRHNYMVSKGPFDFFLSSENNSVLPEIASFHRAGHCWYCATDSFHKKILQTFNI